LMQLEDYFDFETLTTKFGPCERIRIKGHRISIENVLDLYKAGMTPEAIQRDQYPSLTLEQVYATITYYLHKQVEIEAYLKHGEEVAEAYYQEHLQREPDPVVKRLRALRAQPSSPPANE